MNNTIDFPVLTLNRGDLVGHGLTKTQANKLSDIDMQTIAYRIQDSIMLSGVFWSALDKQSLFA